MGATKKLAVVRGGGDLATGVIYRLWKAHFRILILEIEYPTVVRVNISAANAVFTGAADIEGMQVKKINSFRDFDASCEAVQITVSSGTEAIEILKPEVLVDAIMAKRNIGTRKDMAPIVIGLGPGFTAPFDVHAAVETKRGHFLGRTIYRGSPEPNTGIPGIVNGCGTERLLRAPCEGFLRPMNCIGDCVCKGEIVAYIGDEPVVSQIDGIIRGLIHSSVYVRKGMKIGDVDPRKDLNSCFTISDKALAVGGGVLEAVMYLGGLG